MNTFRYFLFSFLLFSVFEASADKFINLSIAPDPVTKCHQIRMDFAVTANSMVGIMPASCTNRPDRPVDGSMVIPDQVTNTFNRVIIPWRYSPYGVLRDGLILEALAGFEKSEYKTTLGSNTNNTFILFGVDVGYQWVWTNGFNISTFIGFAHLIRNNHEVTIVPAESSAVVDYLDQQSNSNTHLAGGVFLGWAF